MYRIHTAMLLAGAMLLAACSPSPGDAARAPQAGTPATTPAPDPAPKTATATGTVERIDADAGTITLAHGPVPALGWPGMTMAFHATPAQVASVHAGDKVSFEFVMDGARARLTRIDVTR